MSQMQLPFDDGLWPRLRQTPLRDALRCRFTGRLSVERAIHPFNLPATCAELVRKVTRKTRLWSLEKTDVAAELAAHFRDGLDAGATADQLIAGFGDPRHAAKLIRRAKIRNRPFAWHTFKWSCRLVVATLILYTLMLGDLLLGRPQVKVDYLRAINRTAEQTPEASRAWPLYRRAYLALYPLSADLSIHPEDSPELQTPYSDHWPEAKAFLRSHQTDLALIRRAAAVPELGLVLHHGNAVAAEDKDVFPAPQIDSNPYASNGPLRDVIFWQASVLHHLCRATAIDAWLAAEDNDPSRVVDDIQAMLGIARHFAQPDIGFFCRYLKLDMNGFAIHRLSDILHDRPNVLSDDQLAVIAHRISAIDPAAELAAGLADEEIVVRDELQRDYTDDGQGNGRITLAGLDRLNGHSQSRRASGYLAEKLFGIEGARSQSLARRLDVALLPIDGMPVADRRQTLAMFAKAVRQIQTDLPAPFWRQPIWPPPPLRLSDYPVLALLMPNPFELRRTAQEFSIHRDTLLVAIALTLYHRRNHHWPEKLDDLTPTFIPALPVDPITGGPLHYKIAASGPLIYSVGVDRIDDGGVPAKDPRVANPLDVAFSTYPLTWDDGHPPTGDWILWPIPEDPR